jgi:hypothetical protein
VDTTSASWAVTFPTAPVDQSRVGVKQVVRGGSNVVTLLLGGTDKFNTTTGPTSLTLSALNQAAIFQYVAATGVWINISDDVPLPASTARAIAMSMVFGTFGVSA